MYNLSFRISLKGIVKQKNTEKTGDDPYISLIFFNSKGF